MNEKTKGSNCLICANFIKSNYYPDVIDGIGKCKHLTVEGETVIITDPSPGGMVCGEYRQVNNG